jgi:two-component system, chemotaxis family, response regulator Rcp1
MLYAAAVKPMEILLVEDGLIDARMTIHALRRSGVHHRLTLVRTAGEALAFIHREGIFARAPRPDLVLLDLVLPDGDGIEVLRGIRDLAGNAQIPVVVLTASDDEDDRESCESLTIDNYITKPVDEEKFLRVIRDHKRLLIYGENVVASGVPS